jgi:predicted transposase/invertase (TIGR01784 family)
MKRDLLKPTADIVFKRIFGQEKEITIEFINLFIDPPHPVVDLEFLPQEMLPDVVDGKISIVDVRCIDSIRQQFIIEMQLVHHVGFNQRALLYAARAYSQQLKKGMPYSDAQPVYLLNIINHTIKANPEKWLHHLSVIDRIDPEFEVPGINLIFLELAKRKNLGNFSIDNPVDRWLTFLAEPEKILAMTKFDLSVYPNLMKAAELLDESNYTQAQLDAYDRHLMAVYDINRSRIESFDKGFEEGVEIGEERGIEKGREEGMDLSVIIIKELQKRELSHEEIAIKHGVELQVVIKLAAALK